VPISTIAGCCRISAPSEWCGTPLQLVNVCKIIGGISVTQLSRIPSIEGDVPRTGSLDFHVT
jgi:hypothetical protein